MARLQGTDCDAEEYTTLKSTVGRLYIKCVVSVGASLWWEHLYGAGGLLERLADNGCARKGHLWPDCVGVLDRADPVSPKVPGITSSQGGIT